LKEKRGIDTLAFDILQHFVMCKKRGMYNILSKNDSSSLKINQKNQTRGIKFKSQPSSLSSPFLSSKHECK